MWGAPTGLTKLTLTYFCKIANTAFFLGSGGGMFGSADLVTWPFWFVRWIKRKIEVWLREKRRKGLKIGKSDRRSRFAQRDECLDVRLKDWALRPRAERLIDMGIDAAWRHVAH
jgi:hypothetical protein